MLWRIDKPDVPHHNVVGHIILKGFQASVAFMHDCVLKIQILGALLQIREGCRAVIYADNAAFWVALRHFHCPVT